MSLTSRNTEDMGNPERRYLRTRYTSHHQTGARHGDPSSKGRRRLSQATAARLGEVYRSAVQHQLRHLDRRALIRGVSTLPDGLRLPSRMRRTYQVLPVENLYLITS